MKQTITIVTWDDAWQDQENFATAHGIKSTHSPMLVKTKGDIVQDDELGISLVCESSEQDGQPVYRGRTFIPRAMIRSVDTYILTKPKAKRSAKPTPVPQETPPTESESTDTQST